MCQHQINIGSVFRVRWDCLRARGCGQLAPRIISDDLIGHRPPAFEPYYTGVEPMLVEYSVIVYYSDPTLNQHRLNDNIITSMVNRFSCLVRNV